MCCVVCAAHVIYPAGTFALQASLRLRLSFALRALFIVAVSDKR
jgi:hypothetical protein